MERERVWMAHSMGAAVTVRQYLVLEPGEEVNDDPPTVQMHVDEWRERHLEYGCALDGSPLFPRPGVGMSA